MKTYYIVKYMLNLNEIPTVVESYLHMEYSDLGDAYKAFERECFPGTCWELIDSSLLSDDRIIGIAMCIPDILNELHQITILIRASDRDKCDELADSYVLDYLEDRNKENWLDEHLADHDIYKVLLGDEVFIAPLTQDEADQEAFELSVSRFYEPVRTNLSHVLYAWHYLPDDSAVDNYVLHVKASGLTEAMGVKDDFLRYYVDRVE